MTDSSRAAPIFIMGYLHSGSTLLQSMLGKNSRVFRSDGETRFFRHLPIIAAQYPDLKNDAVLRDYLLYLVALIHSGYARMEYQGFKESASEIAAAGGVTAADMDALQALVGQEPDHVAAFTATYDFLAAKHSKSSWLDKHPGFTADFEAIFAALPQARVIELVRDPRDVLASKLRRTRKGGNYDPVWDALSWRSAVRGGFQIRRSHPQRIHTVRYEDLVTDPEEALCGICAFLGLQFEPTMLEVGWINSTTAEKGSNGLAHEISTAAIGKWQRDLPPRDVWVAQRLIGREMSFYAYDQARVAAREIAAAPLIVLRSSQDLLGRLRQRWQAGGIPLFWNEVGGYRLRLRSIMRQ